MAIAVLSSVLSDRRQRRAQRDERRRLPALVAGAVVGARRLGWPARPPPPHERRRRTPAPTPPARRRPSPDRGALSSDSARSPWRIASWWALRAIAVRQAATDASARTSSSPAAPAWWATLAGSRPPALAGRRAPAGAARPPVLAELRLHAQVGKLVPEGLASRRPATRTPAMVAASTAPGAGSRSAPTSQRSARPGTTETASTTARAPGVEARRTGEHGLAHGRRHDGARATPAPRSRRTGCRRSAGAARARRRRTARRAWSRRPRESGARPTHDVAVAVTRSPMTWRRGWPAGASSSR